MARAHVCRILAVTVVLTLFGSLSWAAQSSNSLLNPIFQDRVVLQRNAPIRVWGTAAPGDTVTVALAGEATQAEADRDGQWAAQLPALAAGGPHRLIAQSTGGVVQIVPDVMVGDVFLCSGQSNMELPVDRALNAPAEIRNAANERIRMMEVSHRSSPGPRTTLPGPISWEVATPETVSDWSATCYYFARELQPEVDVPIGLIHSSWGGSKISAWMSAEALSSVGGYDEPLALLRQYTDDRRAAQQSFGERWEAWWREATGDASGAEPWQPQAGAQWPQAPGRLGDWKTWEDPELQGFNGMVWFRTTVDLTAAQAERGAVLSLGAIDEVDQTWINGHVVGNTFGWGTERTYAVPADLLQEGENIVVVNVLNTYGSGGMLGDPAQRALITGSGNRLPLASWRYQKAPPGVGTPPRAPWESIGGLSTLHNGMVAPLRDYSLRGALWYQGESDTGLGGDYQDMLDALMAQWREQFGADLPVLVVQLANYGSQPTAPVASGWAELREAQRLATQDDPNAGLAVTIDIGTPHDIHPPNKQEVGRRLARAARNVIYEEAITPSGPVPVRATRSGDTVTVSFEDVHGSLVAYGHDAPIGFELCGSDPDRCRYADAQIDGRRVLLEAEAAEDITRVRYCWADSPICTLYDEAQLPAGPFEVPLSDE